MKADEQLITSLLLETVAKLPNSKRSAYYRAMARLTSDDALVARLTKQADACDEVERSCAQLPLDLGGDTPNGGQP